MAVQVEGQCLTDGWLCPVPDICGYYRYPDEPGDVVVPMWNGHDPIRLGNLAGEVSIDSGYLHRTLKDTLTGYIAHLAPTRSLIDPCGGQLSAMPGNRSITEHGDDTSNCPQRRTTAYISRPDELILTHGVITSVITVETVLNNYARYKLRTPNNFGKRFGVRIKAHMYCLI